jgi:hypothetical protein
MVEFSSESLTIQQYVSYNAQYHTIFSGQNAMKL